MMDELQEIVTKIKLDDSKKKKNKSEKHTMENRSPTPNP